MVFTGTSAWPGWPALWLLPIGVLAAAGQLCMTRAYSTAKTSRGTLVVANVQYSGIVFAAIYSVVLFNDQIPPIGWLGMVLIVGSGIVATVLRARAAPDTPPEAHRPIQKPMPAAQATTHPDGHNAGPPALPLALPLLCPLPATPRSPSPPILNP